MECLLCHWLSFLLFRTCLSDPHVLCIFSSHTSLDHPPSALNSHTHISAPSRLMVFKSLHLADPHLFIPQGLCFSDLRPPTPDTSPPYPHSPRTTAPRPSGPLPRTCLRSQTHIPHLSHLAPPPLSDPHPSPGSASSFRPTSLSGSASSFGPTSLTCVRLHRQTHAPPLAHALTWRHLTAPIRVSCTKGLGTGGGKKDAWRGTIGGRSPAFPMPAPGTVAATAAASAHWLMAQPGRRTGPSDGCETRELAPRETQGKLLRSPSPRRCCGRSAQARVT